MRSIHLLRLSGVNEKNGGARVSPLYFSRDPLKIIVFAHLENVLLFFFSLSIYDRGLSKCQFEYQRKKTKTGTWLLTRRLNSSKVTRALHTYVHVLATSDGQRTKAAVRSSVVLYARGWYTNILKYASPARKIRRVIQASSVGRVTAKTFLCVKRDAARTRAFYTQRIRNTQRSRMCTLYTTTTLYLRARARMFAKKVALCFHVLPPPEFLCLSRLPLLFFCSFFSPPRRAPVLLRFFFSQESRRGRTNVGEKERLSKHTVRGFSFSATRGRLRHLCDERGKTIDGIFIELLYRERNANQKRERCSLHDENKIAIFIINN